MGLWIFPEVVAQSRAPSSPPSVTPQADHPVSTTAAISETFPFCHSVLTFSLSCVFGLKEGLPDYVNDHAHSGFEDKEKISRACKEGLCAKCVPDGEVKREIRCPSGPTGHDVFSLNLGKCYHPLVTAQVTLVFVLGQELNLAASPS